MVGDEGLVLEMALVAEVVGGEGLVPGVLAVARALDLVLREDRVGDDFMPSEAADGAAIFPAVFLTHSSMCVSPGWGRRCAGCLRQWLQQAHALWGLTCLRGCSSSGVEGAHSLQPCQQLVHLDAGKDSEHDGDHSS